MTQEKRKTRQPGRPSKLTPEVQERIISAIRAGNYASVAAAYAGVGERTFYTWMEKGESQPSGKYAQFRHAVKSAESEAEVRAVATIQKLMPDTWQAAMTYLERKFPNRWGRRSRMDVTSGGERVGGVLVVPAASSAEAWGAAVLELKQHQELCEAETSARLQLDSGADGD
jgi:transposase